MAPIDGPAEDLPPGHPAHGDDAVTAGGVLSGHGQGAGGEVPPELGIDEDDERATDDDRPLER